MKTSSCSFPFRIKITAAHKLMKKINKVNSLMNFAALRLQHLCKVLFLPALAGVAMAQEPLMEIDTSNMPPPGISLFYPNKSIAVGDSVIVEITVPKKWHVNANVVSDEFLKASQLNIAAKGVFFGEPVWPTYKKEYNDALEMETFIFDGLFQIIVPIKSIEASYDTTTTNATFHYQACSNFTCLAPNSVHYSLALTVPGALSPLKKKDSNLLILLLFAFIGGLILNLMPCVLPVLSLKLFSLIKQAGESRQRLLALGLVMTAGVLSSFWVLASIITALRAGGALVGWGMQFQSVGFIAFMIALLSAFAMNFFGFFEIWLPGKSLTKMDGMTQTEGLGGAFFTGALLVLLSTPCSAPFLGPAMGFAFSASPFVLFLFFSVAGIGLSFPYLVISAFPKLLSVFPKPGPWMAKLQKWMGILLLGTVVWLLWVVAKMIGVTGVVLLSFLATMSAGFAVITGKWAPPYKSFYREIGFLLGSVLILFFFWHFVASPSIEKILDVKTAAILSGEQDKEGWHPYSKERLESALKSGNAVLLDVTADWCLTCKANEAAVLSREALNKTLIENNVVKIKADWTLQDKEISDLLKSLGRSGVPVYAVYLPNQSEGPILLSEILTLNEVLEALNLNE